VERAKVFFEEMVNETLLHPNVVTFTTLLKGVATLGT
jgi:hypothetical protein